MCQCAAREELLLTKNHNEKTDNTDVVIRLKLVVYFRFSVYSSSSLLQIQVKSWWLGRLWEARYFFFNIL
jgi:hypothetical protein